MHCTSNIEICNDEMTEHRGLHIAMPSSRVCQTHMVETGPEQADLPIHQNIPSCGPEKVQATTAQENIVFSILPAGSVSASPAQLIQGQLTSYEVTPAVGDVVTVSAEIQASGSIGAINGGKVIASSVVNLTASNSTASTTGVDFSASAGNGAVGHLHVTENTGNNTLNIKLQESSDNNTFTDLITFSTVSATTPTSERVETTGTVARYIRAVVTSSITSGSATFITALARK